jgi:hypothetical protein
MSLVPPDTKGTQDTYHSPVLSVVFDCPLERISSQPLVIFPTRFLGIHSFLIHSSHDACTKATSIFASEAKFGSDLWDAVAVADASRRPELNCAQGQIPHSV